MATIHSYQEALNYLGPKDNRPLANNTRLLKSGPAINVVLHGSAIIGYYPDGITLNSCGYRTSTTKSRINEFGPAGYSVYQDRGQWYLREYKTGKTAIFADGITITDDNDILDAGIPSDNERIKDLTKKIKKYARAYTQALITGKIEFPSAGDCLYCQLVDASTGKSLPGIDHLESHFEESYFVPSLLLRAIEAYRVSIIAQARIGELFGCNDAKHEGFDDIVSRQVESSIKRYLKHCFNIAG